LTARALPVPVRMMRFQRLLRRLMLVKWTTPFLSM